MSSSSRAEGTLTSLTEQQENAPVAMTMDAKLMVATASGDVQQLKNLVNKQEEDSKTMVVVMAKQLAANSVEKLHHPPQANMDPRLLALASSGTPGELQTLLDGQASGHGGTDREANELILEGVTAQGDTALHVVAACGQGNDFFTQRRRWRWCLTRAKCHELTTYGDGGDLLESACCIIYGKANHLLFVENNKGDTPLHCAARAGKFNMVKCLIRHAHTEGEGRVKELLRKENKHKETALHEAVRVGNKDIVDLLIEEDSELASFPQDGGASPMYLSIVLRRDEIVKTLYDKSSDGKLSFSGPNGQNALHAAVLRYGARDKRMMFEGLTKVLNWNEEHLCPQNMDLTTQRDENGSTPLHFAATTQRYENGSTPRHFAAAIKFWIRFGPSSICRQVLEANPDALYQLWIQFGPSSICRQVLKANPDALYQPDHAGFFPIHIAASVGASKNVDMFVTKCPGSAGLHDAKGRTFLHVAVEEKKVSVIKSACSNPSLSWIMNMVDSDGNTALHLAVEAGSLQMFCPLVANPQVNINLPNRRGKTPLDIAEYKVLEFYYNQSSEAQICYTLRTVGAVKGVHRRDPLKNNTTARVKHDESKQMEVLKDSTGTLCVGSVLITTVTFGATFAVPGGYIADDQNLGGSPVLARRYAFDAFIVSNALAFVFSAMATTGLMFSGTPFLNPRSRKLHLAIAVYLLLISITSLAAAFALGAYVVLAPVSHKTAVATCVLTSLVPLYKNLEFIWRCILLLPPLSTRKGLIQAWVFSAWCIFGKILSEDWPLIFIFGWAAHAKPAHIQK